MIPGFNAENALDPSNYDYALRSQWSGQRSSAVAPAANWGFCSDVCYRVCNGGAEDFCWYDCMTISNWFPIPLARF